MNKEIERIDYDNINSLMTYEVRIASAHWSELTKISNVIGKDFNFQSR